MASLLQPEQRVLSTLNADGTRRWLNPRLSKGRYWRRRLVTAWGLIALFVLLPHIYIDGRQWVLLDIAHREFTLFGRTFLPTDTLLLALTLISIFITIFLFTALLGRVWCGWACPQTVYLEFVFRPLDRFFEGHKGAAGLPGMMARLPRAPRRIARAGIYLVLSSFLAHTFLAYFVGSHQLIEWMAGPPTRHPFGVGVVVVVTIAMLFDFLFFREQLCIVACPYGRFQSVMLDRHSLIVGYDQKRGEPRGKARRAKREANPAAPDIHLATLPASALGASAGAASNAPPPAGARSTETNLGDCVDCTMCVQVCPTGIDIREGLQMECIHCTQCIDACDTVMEKIGRPRGLIRYSSQAALETGRWSMIRPRAIVYPTILIAAVTALTLVAASKTGFEALLLRGRGQPFNTLPSGEITNQARLRVTNRDREARQFTLEPPKGVELLSPTEPIVVGPGAMESTDVLMRAEPVFFAGTRGVREIELLVRDDKGRARSVELRLLGPMNVRPAPETGDQR